MTQRHSPAVHYPLRRLPELRWIWAAVSLAIAVLVLLWAVHGAGVGIQQWLRIAVVAAISLLCGVYSWRSVCQQPQGMLHWDGRCWWLEAGERSMAFAGGAQVLLDLQSWLVVRWVDGQQRSYRMVVAKNSAPALWADLRRAVYSSAYPSPSSSVPT